MADAASLISLAVETKADPASLAELSRKTAGAIVDAIKKASKGTSKLIGLALEQGVSSGALKGMIWAIRASHKLISKHLATSTEEGARKGLGKAADWFGGQVMKGLTAGQAALAQSFEKEKKRRKEAAAELKAFRDKEVDEQVDKYATGIAGVMAGVTSSLKSGDLKGLTDLVRKAGTGMRQRGRAAAEAGADPNAGMMKQMMGVMGGIGAKIGGAVAAIGALAGGIALVLKVLIDVEAVAKDMNKAFLESGGTLEASLGHQATSAEDLNKQLKRMQQFATDRELSEEWHLASEEIQGVVKGLNQSGMSVRQLTSGVEASYNQMKNLRDATKLAVTYGQMFGKSAEDMAGTLGKVAFETGTTMQRIAEGMQSVGQIISGSTFDVKRFYAAVLEATTGMGLYNVRIESAAGLLKTLSHVLGDVVAGEFLKSINTAFTDMGQTEKWKHALIAGMGNVKSAETSNAQDLSKTLAKDIESLISQGGTQAKSGRAVTKAFGDPADFAKNFAKMSRDEFKKREAIAAGGGADARLLNQVRRTFELAQGGAGKGRTVQSMAALGPVEKLGIRIAEAENVIGKSLSKAEDIDIAAIEGAVGLSSKDTQQLIVLVERLEGRFDVLGNLAKMQQQGTLSEADAAILSELEQQTNTMVQDGKVYARMEDENGIVMADTSRQVKNDEDLLKLSKEFVELASKQDVDEATRLASETSKATRSTFNVLKNMMLKVLLEIAEYTEGTMRTVANILQGLGEWMPGAGARQRDQSARFGAETQLAGGVTAAHREADLISIELEELGKEIDKLGTEDPKRKELEADFARKEKGRDKLLKYADAQQDALDAIPKLDKQFSYTADVVSAAMSTGFGTTGSSSALDSLRGGLEGQAYRGLEAMGESQAEGGGLTEAFGSSQAMQDIWKQLVAAYGQAGAAKIYNAGQEAANSMLGQAGAGEDVEGELMKNVANRFGDAAFQAAQAIEKEKYGAKGAGVYGTAGVDLIVDEMQRRATQAQDFIITKGGDFIQSSPDDTITGTKGGGRGGVTVNVYGGNKREVYAVVRQALRQSGVATA